MVDEGDIGEEMYIIHVGQVSCIFELLRMTLCIIYM